MAHINCNLEKNLSHVSLFKEHSLRYRREKTWKSVPFAFSLKGIYHLSYLVYFYLYLLSGKKIAFFSLTYPLFRAAPSSYDFNFEFICSRLSFQRVLSTSVSIVLGGFLGPNPIYLLSTCCKFESAQQEVKCGSTKVLI